MRIELLAEVMACHEITVLVSPGCYKENICKKKMTHKYPECKFAFLSVCGLPGKKDKSYETGCIIARLSFFSYGKCIQIQ